MSRLPSESLLKRLVIFLTRSVVDVGSGEGWGGGWDSVGYL